MRFRTVMVMVLAGALVASAQDRPARRPRRGTGGMSRGSLLGLLRLEQVQKELKLDGEKLAKVKKVGETLAAEMRKAYAPLREIEDREKRRAKSLELAKKFDGKAREQLRGVLAREQIMRLYQIRMQVRSTLENLANKFIATRLKLKDAQKKKVAELSKAMEAKRTEMFGSMRDATREARTKMYENYRKLRAETDKQALAVLTPEQLKAYKDMQGKKIELRGRGSRPRPRPAN